MSSSILSRHSKCPDYVHLAHKTPAQSKLKHKFSSKFHLKKIPTLTLSPQIFQKKNVEADGNLCGRTPRREQKGRLLGRTVLDSNAPAQSQNRLLLTLNVASKWPARDWPRVLGLLQAAGGISTTTPGGAIRPPPRARAGPQESKSRP